MRRKNLAVIISTALVVISVIVSGIMVDNTVKVTGITSAVTAIIGAIALYFQFKRDKDINQQSFILDFSKQFYETFHCEKIYKMLDDDARGSKFIYTDEIGFDVVKALEWCETLAGLVKNNIVDIDTIDALLGYRFFLITNNKEIQDNELFPFIDYYTGVVWLHKEWTEYSRKRENPIPSDEYNLTDIIEKKEAEEKQKVV